MMKVVDMHCDTILKLYDDLHHGKEGSLLENDGHIDFCLLYTSPSPRDRG